MKRFMVCAVLTFSFFAVSVCAQTKEPSDKLESSGKRDQIKQAEQEASVSKEPYTFVSSRKTGTVDRVEVTLEAAGEITQFLEDQKSESDQIEFVAKFRYEEFTKKFAPKQGTSLQSLRYYDTAKGAVTVSDRHSSPELEKNRKLIVCNINNHQTTLFSPTGTLKNDQLLLIEDLPGNTLLLDQLLPEYPVKTGDSWEIPEKALCSLLGLDLVEKHEIEAVLTSVKNDVALVEIAGNAEGAYLGAASEMEVRVKYQFDLKQNRITWLGLLIQENRSLGHVGPAVKLIARLLIDIKPDQKAEYLTEENVKTISTEADPKLLQLRFESPEKALWTFTHDRRWYVILDEPGNTKMRMLNKGEVVSQCDITEMPEAENFNFSTLETFQKKLKEGLGEYFGEFVSSSQRKNENNYRELRVIVDGTVKDMPLRWVYYLISDQDGNQAILAFVIQADMLEVFDKSDIELVRSFRLTPKSK
ncbi:MAG: hypothetical protein LBQ54_08250 [Planctomycetaceae bacterium]|jgi:hypothetical protein|nr:hypothetical protein [Planctomycetaceae bacterium]